MRSGRRAALVVAVLVGGTACSSSVTVRTPDGSPVTAAPTRRIGELSPSGADLTRYTSQRLTWTADACPGSMRKVMSYTRRTQCATVTAPKDYGDPGKGDLRLLVSRTTHSGDGAARALFTNPGGPGAPAVDFAAIVAAITPQGRTHDVYGVDPRGTGGSTPLTCTRYGAAPTDARDRSASAVQQRQAAAKRTVEDCWRAHGDYLPYLTTDNTARDHELVRRLIHADTIDYYGVSAGTWLGAHYATWFPTRVGRFVLDSNTDFAAGFDRTFAAQAQGFQRRFDEQFVPWLARQDDRYGMGADPGAVRAGYEHIRKAAEEHRLGAFTPDAVDGLTAQLLYTDRSFPGLGSLLGVLRLAVDGDRRALDAAERAVGDLGSGDSRSSEETVFMATLCNDAPWTKDPGAVSAAEGTTGSKYPLVGYAGPALAAGSTAAVSGTSTRAS